MDKPVQQKSKAPTWLAYRPRPDLVDSINNAGHLPYWSQRFLDRHNKDDLISAVDDLIDRVLVDSGATTLGLDSATNLQCVARYLNARIDILRSPIGPRGLRLNSSLKWVRGSTRVGANMNWRIIVGDANEFFLRESIAHELGHILLYWLDGTIDFDAWQKTRWTLSEESVCNYIGRSLMMPRSQFNKAQLSTSHPAQNLIISVVSRFKVPHRLAALRWLDESHGVAAIEWRQYHPFSEYVIKQAAKAVPTCGHNLIEIGRSARSQFPNAGHADAFRIWVHILSGETKSLAVIPNLELHLSETDRKLALDLFNPAKVYSCRPEWIMWKGRPRNAFVPLHRGYVRKDSLAARSFMGATFSESQLEDVSIGDFSGRFLVSTFAIGHREEGKRFVLQTFSS